MRNHGWMWSILCLIGVVVSAGADPLRAAAQESAPDAFVGTWTGTWEDPEQGGGGGFELTVEKGADGALAGRVSVTGEPTYKAVLKSLVFDGPRMTAEYDFPPSDEAKVVLTAVFDGSTAKGTWSLREKASDGEAAKGRWSVSRK